MEKPLRIPVSFKKEEENLYKFAKSKRNASCYIKDLIYTDMKNSKETNVKSIESKKTNDLGFDF